MNTLLFLILFTNSEDLKRVRLSLHEMIFLAVILLMPFLAFCGMAWIIFVEGIAGIAEGTPRWPFLMMVFSLIIGIICTAGVVSCIRLLYECGRDLKSIRQNKASQK